MIQPAAEFLDFSESAERTERSHLAMPATNLLLLKLDKSNKGLTGQEFSETGTSLAGSERSTG